MAISTIDLLGSPGAKYKSQPVSHGTLTSAPVNTSRPVNVNGNILTQIVHAGTGLIEDILAAFGLGTHPKYQDRASALPAQTDILMLNSQLTPAAALNDNVPENPELRNSAQDNEQQIKFLSLPNLAPTPSPSIPTFSTNGNFSQPLKPIFGGLREFAGPIVGSTFTRAGQPVSQIVGKRLLQDAQSGAGSGSGSGSGGGASGGSSGSGGSGGGGGGGFSGGGRTTISVV